MTSQRAPLGSQSGLATVECPGNVQPVSKRYRTIVADPPWDIGYQTLGVGGRRRNVTKVGYSFMSLDEIKALPVASLAAADAHLYLWTTRRLFREGTAAEVVRAWGFEPCGELIWGLRNPGMGGFLGNGHEPVIIGRRGDLPFPEKQLPAGVIFWKQPYAHGKIHSAKPDGFLDTVERVSPEPRIELFARRQRLGWDTWGNEALEHVDLDGRSEDTDPLQARSGSQSA
jgi:N6-adenosine-specific RNA methylase IME4